MRYREDPALPSWRATGAAFRFQASDDRNWALFDTFDEIMGPTNRRTAPRVAQTYLGEGNYITRPAPNAE